MPFFTKFYELFYVNGVKTIPANIAVYITPISLAFWIMDDGHWNHGLVLNTQSFSTEGVSLLVSAINQNFGVSSYMRLEKKQPVIYIPKKDVSIIAEAVKEFMHPSTHYKLGL